MSAITPGSYWVIRITILRAVGLAKTPAVSKWSKQLSDASEFDFKDFVHFK